MSEFALVFALFGDLLAAECAEQMMAPGIARIPSVIRERHLDHDWYQVVDLGEFLTCEADYNAIETLLAAAVRRIRNVGWSAGVRVVFYESFPNAKFAPPQADGSHWRVVAWPFVQIAGILLHRDRITPSEALMGQLGWFPKK